MKITRHDIKQALLDGRFRATLPEEFNEEVQQFIKNPGCACNNSLYTKIARKASKQLQEYFPTKEATTAEEFDKQMEKLSKNNWQVINCSTQALSGELKKLPPGRKQIEIARWQDQVTVVVNHLDDVY